MFWIASNEGLILNGSSVHAGLRSRLSGWDDYQDDERQGFLRVSADDIDEMGTAGIVSAILERIGTDTPTYLSLDIDVLDPGLVSRLPLPPSEVTLTSDLQQCPGTGTPEAGGWTSREVIRILRGLELLNVVGADIVEVAPAYDGRGEETALVAAQVGFEILTSWVGRGMSEIEKAKGQNDEGHTLENGKDEL